MSTDPTDPTNAELAARFDAHETKDEERHVELLAAVKAARDAAAPTWTFDNKTLAGIVALISAVTGLVTALGLGGTEQATAAAPPVHVVEQAQHAPLPPPTSLQPVPAPE